MTPREFERLNRGFLIRQEFEYDRMRRLMALVANAVGNKATPQKIMHLPNLDKLAQATISDSEEHNRLRDFVERYKAKYGSY